MKQNYLLIAAFLLLGLTSIAQPVLLSSDVTDFSAIAHEVPDMTNLTVGNAGANQTWDYHLLVPSANVVYLSSFPVDSAPGYWNFLSANFCQKITSSVLSDHYTFMKVTATGVETLGTTAADGVISVEYADTQFTQLPLQYLDTYNNTYQSTTASQPTTIIETYDAYGTLTTSYGTYPNAFRVKGVDANYTRYTWAKTNPYIPLLIIKVNNTSGAIMSVTLYQDTTLGMAENTLGNAISVSPNPAGSLLQLQLSNTTIIDKVMITDLTGKILVMQMGNSTQINVESLAAGVYIVQAQSAGNTYQAKFIKQ